MGRRFFPLILLLLVFFPSVVYAADEETYVVGICQAEEPSLSSLSTVQMDGNARLKTFEALEKNKTAQDHALAAEKLLNDFPLQFTRLGKEGLAAFSKMLQRKQTAEAYDKLAELYGSHATVDKIQQQKKAAIEAAPKLQASYPSVTPKLLDDQVFLGMLLKGTADRQVLLKQLCARESVNGILVFLVSDVDGYTRLRLYFYDSLQDTFDVLLDGLETDLDDLTVDTAIVRQFDGKAAFAKILQPSSGLEIRLVPPSFDENAKKLEDMKENLAVLTAADGLVLLPYVPCKLLLTAFDYEPKLVKISGKLQSLDGKLEQTVHPPLHLVSLTGPVHWTCQGKDFGFSSTVLLAHPQIPFVALATKDGFAILSYQTNVEQTRVTVDLRPKWMADTKVSSLSQDRFYYSLETIFAIFAIQLTANTIAETVGEDTTATQVVSTMSTGLTLAALLSMGQQLAQYIRLSGI
ncbi:MAG: hypothetical protein LKE40_01640 [Spirochaetia bacterium]|jgi:hypothetical protein|nr:hypothetical protein [Spirochaetia bacterium]